MIITIITIIIIIIIIIIIVFNIIIQAQDDSHEVTVTLL